MDTGSISRAEHEEFRRSMELANKLLETENTRQNKRLEQLEAMAKENSKLVENVGKLAVNMENMLKIQEKQEKRLGVLESRDGEMWRKIVGYVITTIAGIVVGLIFTHLGM